MAPAAWLVVATTLAVAQLARPAGAAAVAQLARPAGAATPPTGQLVGYSDAAGVFEVAPDGTGARQLPGTHAGSASPAWSHDGNVVAFTEAARPGDQSGDVGLATVVADGTCRVAFPNPGPGVYSSPAWSRDGSHLAYVHSDPGQPFGTNPRVEVSRSDGSGATTLADTFSAATSLAWAPDGSGRLVYSDSFGLHLVDTRTGTGRVLDPTGDTEFAQWSPGGRRIAYSISTQPALWVIDADGTHRTRLTPLTPPFPEDFLPAWSPDGSRIAFNRSGLTPSGGADVWVIGADGTGARAVTSSHSVGAGPLWSPDGTLLAYEQFAGMQLPPSTDVWVVGADGSNPHRVASGARLEGFFSRGSVPASDAGYRLAAASGGVAGFGTECSLGSAPVMSGVVVPPGTPTGLHQFVAMASTPDDRGYWLAAGDGTVFSFGTASPDGSAPPRPPGRPVVAMASTPDGGGYWLGTADGGVFSFGDAGFHGSLAGTPLNGTIVGMASTPDGRGYWLVGSDGGVFSFGDAQFEGSTYTSSPATGPLAGQLATRIVGITPIADGHGYWLVAAGGGVFTYGRAPYLGSMGGRQLNGPMVGITATRDRGGYWLVGADGGVFSFGDAVFRGARPPNGSRVVAMSR